MWDLSSLTTDQTCGPLQWKCRVLTTGPPGKSLDIHVIMRALSFYVSLWVISVFPFYLSAFGNFSTVDVLCDWSNAESKCRKWN